MLISGNSGSAAAKIPAETSAETPAKTPVPPETSAETSAETPVPPGILKHKKVETVAELRALSSTATARPREVYDELVKMAKGLNKGYYQVMSKVAPLVVPRKKGEKNGNERFLDSLPEVELPRLFKGMDTEAGRVIKASRFKNRLFPCRNDSLSYTFHELRNKTAHESGILVGVGNDEETFRLCKAFCPPLSPDDRSEVLCSVCRMHKSLNRLPPVIDDLKEKLQRLRETKEQCEDQTDELATCLETLANFEVSLVQLSISIKDIIPRLCTYVNDLLPQPAASATYSSLDDMQRKILDRLYVQERANGLLLQELFKDELSYSYSCPKTIPFFVLSTESPENEVCKFETAVDAYQDHKNDLFDALMDRKGTQIDPMNVYELRLMKCSDSCKNLLDLIKKAPEDVEHKTELVNTLKGEMKKYRSLLEDISQLNYQKVGDIGLRLALGKAMPPMSIADGSNSLDNQFRVLLSEYNETRDMIDKLDNITNMEQRLNGLSSRIEAYDCTLALAAEMCEGVCEGEIDPYVVIQGQLKKNIDKASSALQEADRVSGWYMPLENTENTENTDRATKKVEFSNIVTQLDFVAIDSDESDSDEPDSAEVGPAEVGPAELSFDVLCDNLVQFAEELYKRVENFDGLSFDVLRNNAVELQFGTGLCERIAKFKLLTAKELSEISTLRISLDEETADETNEKLALIKGIVGELEINMSSAVERWSKLHKLPRYRRLGSQEVMEQFNVEFSNIIAGYKELQSAGYKELKSRPGDVAGSTGSVEQSQERQDSVSTRVETYQVVRGYISDCLELHLKRQELENELKEIGSSISELGEMKKQLPAVSELGVELSEDELKKIVEPGFVLNDEQANEQAEEFVTAHVAPAFFAYKDLREAMIRIESCGCTLAEGRQKIARDLDVIGAYDEARKDLVRRGVIEGDPVLSKYVFSADKLVERLSNIRGSMFWAAYEEARKKVH